MPENASNVESANIRIMKPVYKKRLFSIVLVWVALLSMVAVGAATAASDKLRATDEYQVKAAFLYNFIIYTQWPEAAFKDPRSPINVTIFGPDVFGDAFDLLAKKQISGRKIVVQYKDKMESIDDCHVVFFANTKDDSHFRRLSKMDRLPILTVGDIPGFARHGGMINFVLADNKIRFEINPSTAQQAGLKISSKLLNLATIVRE